MSDREWLESLQKAQAQLAALGLNWVLHCKFSDGAAEPCHQKSGS
jgi:hypothetical protein